VARVVYLRKWRSSPGASERLAPQLYAANLSTAQAPDTCAAAIEVPDASAYPPPGIGALIRLPGASRFRRSALFDLGSSVIFFLFNLVSDQCPIFVEVETQPHIQGCGMPWPTPCSSQTTQDIALRLRQFLIRGTSISWFWDGFLVIGNICFKPLAI